MSEKNIETENIQDDTNEMICPETSCETDVEEEISMEQGIVSENNEFEDQYQTLPIWKKAVLMILCMGALTAVIMLIDFLIDFFIAIITNLLK